MSRARPLLALLFCASSLGLAACAPPETDEASDGADFQGTVSNLAEMSFQTQLRAETEVDAERLVQSQLYWLVGPFHQLGGDPRLTWAKTTKVRTEQGTDEAIVTFDVTMEVAWPKSRELPKSYDIVLPRRVDSAAQQAFFEKYKNGCIDPYAHDVDWVNAWYDFRPDRDTCKLDANDVIRISASVKKAQDNTVDTYPEYDRIWQDKRFQAVVVFGRDKAESTTDTDLGAAEYKKYVEAMKKEPGLTDIKVKEEDFEDGAFKNKHATIDAKIGKDRSVHIAVFLLAKPSLSTNAFVRRYDPETEEADYIGYAGHAGLGGNIQVLQGIGKHKAGQYQLFVYDGCDTFAYVDKTLFDSKREVNGADKDPNGTRDFDVILNALPTPWMTGDPSLLTLTRKLIDDAKPTSYEKILEIFSRAGAPVVVGDEDNKFRPR